MGGPIGLERMVCKSAIHDFEHDLRVTTVGWVDVPDGDVGNFRARRTVDTSSLINNFNRGLIYC